MLNATLSAVIFFINWTPHEHIVQFLILTFGAYFFFSSVLNIITIILCSFKLWCFHVCWLRIFLCLSGRRTRRTARAMGASQVLKSCCTNSWRESRCRKRWQSSYEKGIVFSSVSVCLLIFFPPKVTRKPAKQWLWKNISPFLCWWIYPAILLNTPKMQMKTRL